MQPSSVYLHIPFCKQRCGYCDFTTFAGIERLISAYIDALCGEIEQVSVFQPARVPVQTIYFGGGTPSLLAPHQVKRVIDSVKRKFILASDAEISLEANPGTVTLESLSGFRQAGINRLSLGVQSAHSDELRLLNRIHTVDDVTNAVIWARHAGFTNLSLDLIFALPGQSLELWQESVRFAVGLGADHLSFYNLTIEDGTPLKFQVDRGDLPVPDNDLAADMYEWAIDHLDVAGFQHYEISNWARRRGDEWMTCRHNLQYWRNQPYFGFGAGAHGYTGGVRTANISSVPWYIDRIRNGSTHFPVGPAAESVSEIGQKDEMQETMMMGLRLLQEGVSRERFYQRFGVCVEDIFGKEIRELTRLGLIEGDDPIRLTRRGCLVGNQVFMRFVGN